MLRKVLIIIEILFYSSFWLQTRINLRDWWPNLFSAPLNSDYLIPFVYLSDILLVALLIVWVANKGIRYQISDIRKTYPLNLKPETWIMNPIFWLGLFASSTLISVLINGGNWWGWYGWWRIVEGIGLSFFIYHRWRQPKAKYHALLILGLGLIVESAILIGEWGRQASLGWQWLGEWSFTVHTPGIAKVIFNGQEYMRAYGTFAHPNIAAAALVLGITIVGWWLINNLKLHPKQLTLSVNQEIEAILPQWSKALWRRSDWNGVYVTTLIISLLLVGLFVTFSRSAWVVLIGCLSLLSVSFSRIIQQLHISKSKIFTLALGVIVIGSIWGPMVWSRFNALDNTDRLSIERRIQLNDVAVELLEEHAWLGVGVNNFITHLAEFGPLYGIGIWREPVHNLFLLITVEAGIIGLVLWTIAHSLVLAKLISKLKQGRGNSTILLLIILWLAMLLLSLTDHYWWTSQPGRLIWFVLVGVSLAITKEIKLSENKSLKR